MMSRQTASGRPPLEEGVQVGPPQHRPVLVVGDAQHRLLVPDLQVDDVAALEFVLGGRILDPAAAEREDCVLAAQQLGRDLVLELAEGRLTVRDEDLPDAAAGAALDDQVAVDERQPQLLREHVPDRGLARPHEPDQADHAREPPVISPASSATARSASRYESRPNPAMVPAATPDTTDKCLNVSRAAGFDMCTSISGAVRIASASLSAYE